MRILLSKVLTVRMHFIVAKKTMKNTAFSEPPEKRSFSPHNAAGCWVSDVGNLYLVNFSLGTEEQGLVLERSMPCVVFTAPSGGSGGVLGDLGFQVGTVLPSLPGAVRKMGS